MEECFRFLINVDQCLNMSNFDIFFYKLESRHKFHLSQVQLFGERDSTSLRHAVSDIRMYLDKYPYDVGDYQIIVALRGPFRPRGWEWKDCLLYRLLQIHSELCRFRIYLSSKERTEKALNLVMLYDADFSADLPRLDDYMSGPRFREDCGLLLEQTGSDLPAYLDRPAEERDQAVAEVIRGFLSSQPEQDSGDGEEEDLFSPRADSRPAPEWELSRRLAAYLKAQMENYQVFEAMIDRNSRRDNILALLRLVEFITSDVARDPARPGGMVTLARRCQENWTRVWQDTGLEHRYASMLRMYYLTLKNAADDLERPSFTSPTAQRVPDEDIPGDDAIDSEESVFSSADPQNQGFDLKRILQSFLADKQAARAMAENWEGVYQRLRQSLARMEFELRRYAEDLSLQYSAVLERRKRDTIPWQTAVYTTGCGDGESKKLLTHLEDERSRRLAALKAPHMNPSLSFQDQLNMENALEQTNLDLRFYINCIRAVTAVNLFALVFLVAVLTLGHYSLLQPYVFQGIDTLAAWLAYVAALVLLMLLTWRAPLQYFQRRIRARVLELQEQMDRYIRGYFEKAKNFRAYINLLNQLDYITRYYRLQTRARRADHRLAQGYLWHKVQLKHHLEKLQFLQGLIDLSDDTAEVDLGKVQRTIPAINGDRVDDVVDSPIYWPQG